MNLITYQPVRLNYFSGDFNGCSLHTDIPTYKQYVTCTTRGNKTIDMCYCNIKNTYKSVSKPPLGTSVHIIIQLLPTYKSVLITWQILDITLYPSGMRIVLRNYVAALNVLSGTPLMTRAAVFLTSLTLLLIT